jgi:hypothetical protein
VPSYFRKLRTLLCCGATEICKIVAPVIGSMAGLFAEAAANAAHIALQAFNSGFKAIGIAAGKAKAGQDMIKGHETLRVLRSTEYPRFRFRPPLISPFPASIYAPSWRTP